MAWSYRKNVRHRNSKKDVRKAVCNKTKRKTKNEMAGWRFHGPEKDGDKRMERQSKGSRGLEAYFKGGQGPPRAVASPKKKKKKEFRHRAHKSPPLVRILRQNNPVQAPLNYFEIMFKSYCLIYV